MLLALRTAEKECESEAVADTSLLLDIVLEMYCVSVACVSDIESVCDTLASCDDDMELDFELVSWPGDSDSLDVREYVLVSVEDHSSDQLSVRVLLNECVRVNDEVTVGVCVVVRDAENSRVSDRDADCVDENEPDADTSSVSDDEAVTECDGVAVGVNDRERVGMGVRVFIFVGDGEAVCVGVSTSVRVLVAKSVSVRVSSSEKELVRDAVNIDDGENDMVGVGMGVADGVGILVGVIVMVTVGELVIDAGAEVEGVGIVVFVSVSSGESETVPLGC